MAMVQGPHGKGCAALGADLFQGERSTAQKPYTDTLPRAPWLAPVAAVLCALVVRLPFVLAATFPLGDGGLFAQIIDDIRAHGFVLPAFTSFNGGSIPLCYPPLGFYLAALSGFPTLEALRWFPLLLSALVPGAVVLLGRLALRSEVSA